MPSERVQRVIDNYLDQIETAAASGHWNDVITLTNTIKVLDNTNQDAHTFGQLALEMMHDTKQIEPVSETEFVGREHADTQERPDILQNNQAQRAGLAETFTTSEDVERQITSLRQFVQVVDQFFAVQTGNARKAQDEFFSVAYRALSPVVLHKAGSLLKMSDKNYLIEVATQLERHKNEGLFRIFSGPDRDILDLAFVLLNYQDLRPLKDLEISAPMSPVHVTRDLIRDLEEYGAENYEAFVDLSGLELSLYPYRTRQNHHLRTLLDGINDNIQEDKASISRPVDISEEVSQKTTVHANVEDNYWERQRTEYSSESQDRFSNQSVSSQSADSAPPNSLGGWLFFVGIGLVVSPLVLSINIITTIADLASAEYFGYEGLSVTTILVELGFVFGYMWLAYEYFNKKRSFPNRYLLISVLGIIWSIIFLVIAMATFGSGPALEAFAPRIFISSLWSLFWISYILISEQVKVTFVQD